MCPKTLSCLGLKARNWRKLISFADLSINTIGIIIAVYYRCTRLLMATEFPDDPEVDLGFRDPATENSIPKTAEEWKPQIELRLDDEPRASKERLSNPWWSLRITIILFLSALGGLVSSIFLFERAERPNIFKPWKREVYTTAKTIEAPPATPNLDLRLDQLRAFRIGGEIGGLPIPSETPDQFTSLTRQRPSFDAALQLPPSAPPLAPSWDFSVGNASEMVAAENVSRENATQTERTVRATTEKMRKHRIVRFRRRAAKRVVHSAKSIASFWAFWSRHFLSSGLAGTSPNRRFATRKSIRRKSKALSWFPVSWHAVAAQPIKQENQRTAVPHSSIGATGRLQMGTPSGSNRGQPR